MNIGTSINASFIASYTNTAAGARNPLPTPGNGNTKPANLNPDARLDEKDKAQPKNNNTEQRSPTADQHLTKEEQQEVRKLQQRDREVRAHEAAHLAAGGAHVRGGIQFDHERGPDGRMYAVGGEVSIDSSPVPNDPEATLRKANQVRAAALAPADPSPQDRAVAADAAAMASEARSEMLQESREETKEQAAKAAGGNEHAKPNNTGNSDENTTSPQAQSPSPAPVQITPNSPIAAYQQAGQANPTPRLDLSA